MASLRASIQKARMAALVESRAALTPDQRKKLRELRPGGRGMGMGESPLDGAWGLMGPPPGAAFGPGGPPDDGPDAFDVPAEDDET
jgi:hypothetical protein